MTLTKPHAQHYGATFMYKPGGGDLLLRRDKTRRLMVFKNLPKVGLTDFEEEEEEEEE